MIIWKFLCTLPQRKQDILHIVVIEKKKETAIGQKLSPRDPGILERQQMSWAEMDLGKSPMHICFAYGCMGI